LAQGKAPYSGLSELEVMNKIQNENPPTLKNPEKWDPLFAKFIEACLVKKASSRFINK
jgi:serine/threonine protein kinase